MAGPRGVLAFAPTFKPYNLGDVPGYLNYGVFGHAINRGCEAVGSGVFAVNPAAGTGGRARGLYLRGSNLVELAALPQFSPASVPQSEFSAATGINQNDPLYRKVTLTGAADINESGTISTTGIINRALRGFLVFPQKICRFRRLPVDAEAKGPPAA